MGYSGIQWYTGGYNWIQGDILVHRGIHRYTGGYNVIQGDTMGYNGVQWDTMGYNGIQGDLGLLYLFQTSPPLTLKPKILCNVIYHFCWLF